MDSETKKLLEDNLRLAEENNVMLRKIHRSVKVRGYITIAYWVFIIGSAVGAYYFIEPYTDQIMNSYGGAKEDLDSINKFIENLKN